MKLIACLLLIFVATGCAGEGKGISRVISDSEFYSFYDGKTGKVNCEILKDTLKLREEFPSLTIHLRSKMQTQTVEAIRNCFPGEDVILKEEFYSGPSKDAGAKSLKELMERQKKSK